MTKNISDIEKCAKLIGYEKVEGSLTGMVYQDGKGHLCTFDPLTNKSDLMDLECAIEIHIEWYSDNTVIAMVFEDTFHEEKTVSILHHDNDKFTARAHAVVAVAVQIYDRTNP